MKKILAFVKEMARYAVTNVFYRSLLIFGFLFLASGACVCLFRENVGSSSNVPSPSMEPTLQVGHDVFYYRLAYLFTEPERGDIICFETQYEKMLQEYLNTTKRQYLVKRIIGMPGEKVWIGNGNVYINDEPLDEPYLTVTTEGEFGPYYVPDGCYFVLGDNRGDSWDSRCWEDPYVPREAIREKACYDLTDWKVLS